MTMASSPLPDMPSLPTRSDAPAVAPGRVGSAGICPPPQSAGASRSVADIVELLALRERHLLLHGFDEEPPLSDPPANPDPVGGSERKS